MTDEYEPKPINVSSKEQFEKFADELISNWKQYSEMKKRMEVLNVSVRDYMVKNNINIYEIEKGYLSIVKQNRNVLNRALINDIQQYYEKKQYIMLFKSCNS